jgi:hypothetical protein
MAGLAHLRRIDPLEPKLEVPDAQGIAVDHGDFALNAPPARRQSDDSGAGHGEERQPKAGAGANRSGGMSGHSGGVDGRQARSA